MVRDVSEIMKELGWADGARIPVANEENKKLENLVEQKTKQKAQLIADTEEATDRLDAIKKHLIAAEKQRKNCQDLLHATRRELDVAQGLERTVRADRDSHQRHIKQIDKEMQELYNTSDKLRSEISHRQSQIEKLRKALRCESESLFSWDERHNQGEVDLQILKIDLREDAAVFKEVEIKRERLQTEVEQKRRAADNVTTEVALLEETLDRTAQMYRQMHDDRCTLLKQWEASVRALHRKDQDINKTLAEIVTLRQQGRMRMAELIEAKEMHDNLKANNMETEATVTETQHLISNLKNQDLSLTKNITDLQNELFGIRRIIVTTQKRIESQHAENKKMKEDICHKQEKIEALKCSISELSKRFDEASKTALSAEQRAEQIEELIKAEQHQYSVFSYDIRRLRGLLYRTQQEHAGFMEERKLQEIEIATQKKTAVAQLRDKAVQEERLARTKEQLYNLENEELMLKSRLSSVLGEDSEYEDHQKQAKLLQLEEILKEKKDVLHLLNTQIERLDLDYRQLGNMMNTTNIELQKVKEDRTNLQLLVDGGKRSLKSARASLNDSLIELAVQKVRAKQIANAARRESGKVVCLKKERIEFEACMKERMLEINAQKEKQTAQRKLLMESRSMIAQELNGLNSRIDQSKKRFEIASDAIGRDEFGEYLTPIQIKIQMTQERLLLLKEGDTLDAKIKKAEKEIEAMENTLKVVNVTNDNYRNRLAIIDPEGPEADELNQLEHTYLETMLQLKKYREQQTHAEARLCELDGQVQLFESRLEELAKLQGGRAAAADDLSHELREQDVKLHRAESQLNRIIRQLRNRSNSTMFLMEEKDIMIRDIAERNNNALDQLSQLAAAHLDVGPAITRLLEVRGLALPPPKSRALSDTSRSSLSSSSSSICSSASSASSCVTTAKKLFHSSKLAAPYRGTMQTSSQMHFPMKDTIVCCAPHSPITMSSETLSVASAMAIAGPREQGAFDESLSDRRGTVQIHATPSASMLMTTTSKHAPASLVAKRRFSRTSTSSQGSAASRHTTSSAEEGDLLTSLNVEPITSGWKLRDRTELSPHESSTIRTASSTAVLFTKSATALPSPGSSEILASAKLADGTATPMQTIDEQLSGRRSQEAALIDEVDLDKTVQPVETLVPQQIEEEGEEPQDAAEKSEEESPEQSAGKSDQESPEDKVKPETPRQPEDEE